MPFNILTPLQSEILHFLYDNGLGERGFFFTGGTALCEYYLPYRYSKDLDFFVQDSDILSHIEWVESKLNKHEYPFKFIYRNPSYCAILIEKDKNLKLDFATHPQNKMAPNTKHGNIVVDSLEDIAVNKVSCISGSQFSGRDDAKDVFDLYYIIKNTEFTFDQLLDRAKEKDALFENEGQLLSMASSKLMNVLVSPLPPLIEPIDPDDVQEFFKQIAVELINRFKPKR